MRMWEPPAAYPKSRNVRRHPCILWSRRGLMVTDTAPKGGYAPTLFAVSDTEFGEYPFHKRR